MTSNPFDWESNPAKEKLLAFSHHMGWPMIKDKGNWWDGVSIIRLLSAFSSIGRNQTLLFWALLLLFSCWLLTSHYSLI